MSLQITGTVLDISERFITVKKGVETYQLLRDPSFEAFGDLKVGSKASFTYRPLAFRAVVKPESESPRPETP